MKSKFNLFAAKNKKAGSPLNKERLENTHVINNSKETTDITKETCVDSNDTQQTAGISNDLDRVELAERSLKDSDYDKQISENENTAAKNRSMEINRENYIEYSNSSMNVNNSNDLFENSLISNNIKIKTPTNETEKQSFLGNQSGETSVSAFTPNKSHEIDSTDLDTCALTSNDSDINNNNSKDTYSKPENRISQDYVSDLQNVIVKSNEDRSVSNLLTSDNVQANNTQISKSCISSSGANQKSSTKKPKFNFIAARSGKFQKKPTLPNENNSSIKNHLTNINQEVSNVNSPVENPIVDSLVTQQVTDNTYGNDLVSKNVEIEIESNNNICEQPKSNDVSNENDNNVLNKNSSMECGDPLENLSSISQKCSDDNRSDTEMDCNTDFNADLLKTPSEIGSTSNFSYNGPNKTKAKFNLSNAEQFSSPRKSIAESIVSGGQHNVKLSQNITSKSVNNEISIRKPRLILKPFDGSGRHHQEEIKTMSCRDLMFLPPVYPKSRKRIERDAQKKTKKAKSVKNEEDDTSSVCSNVKIDTEEADANVSLLPSMRIDMDGNIVMEESPNVQLLRNVELDNEEVEDDRELNLYAKRTKIKRWNTEETSNFYLALAVVKTNFSMMESVFDGRRKRSELKRKYDKEQKINWSKVQKTLLSTKICDLNSLTQLLKKNFEEADLNKKQKKPKVSKVAKQSAKRPVKRAKRSVKNAKSSFVESDESSTVVESDSESGRTKSEIDV